jgi:hypothetical protein
MQISCSECGRGFEATSPRARLCSPKCRKRASRRPQPLGAPVAPVRPVPEPPRAVDAPAEPTPLRYPLVDATRRELEAGGVLDTALGQQALRLAERMHSPHDTGSALAAVSKELRSVLAAALADATPVADALDELAQRRQVKAAGG